VSPPRASPSGCRLCSVRQCVCAASGVDLVQIENAEPADKGLEALGFGLASRYCGPVELDDSREVLERFHDSLDLVDTIASQLLKKLGSLVELEDLVSFGREGLLDAARRYDASRGVPFRAYAQFRVRGAAYDGVRRMSALPRSLYQKLASLEAQWLTSEGEAPYAFAEETAFAQNVAQANEVLADHLAGMAMAATLGLIIEKSGEPSDARDTLGMDPEQQLASAELRYRIEQLLATLDAEECEVVRRHYFEGERLEDIANLLDISKSWASRLHTRALSRLAKRLKTAD
jgi:RNA polymerase sigma factor FliA